MAYMTQYIQLSVFLILWAVFVLSTTVRKIQSAQELLKDPVLCHQIYFTNKPVEIRIQF